MASWRSLLVRGRSVTVSELTHDERNFASGYRIHTSYPVA